MKKPKQTGEPVLKCVYSKHFITSITCRQTRQELCNSDNSEHYLKLYKIIVLEIHISSEQIMHLAFK